MNPHLRVTMVQADLAWQDADDEPAAPGAAFWRSLGPHRPDRAAGDVFDRLQHGLRAVLRGDGRAHGRLDARGGRSPRLHHHRQPDRSRGRPALQPAHLGAPDGSLVYYDKRHLFRLAGEQKSFNAGDRRLVVDIKGWRVCPLICYDLRFPVWSRARNDYDLLLYVANWPRVASSPGRRCCGRAPSRTSATSSASTASARDGNGADYCGGSVAIDFLGQPLSDEHDGDDVETVVLDREALAAFRTSFPVHLDADDSGVPDCGLGQVIGPSSSRFLTAEQDHENSRPRFRHRADWRAYCCAPRHQVRDGAGQRVVILWL